MSLASEYFFNAITGRDTNDGLSDVNAKQSYDTLLILLNGADAGTIFNLAAGCVFLQTTSFRLSNSNSVTEVVSLTFDGTHCICEMARPSNITVGQETIIKGANESQFNGVVLCAEVVNNVTFKYLPLQSSPPAVATADPFFNKIRCSAGEIIVRSYVSEELDLTNPANPICEYTDASQSQHRIDRGALQGLRFSHIIYRYKGTGGKPNCFFIYAEGKESITFDCVEIDGYYIGIYPNGKAGAIQDITVSHCVIVNNWSQGILGHPGFSLIEYTFFGNNGHDKTGGNNRLHNLYLSTCHYVVVRFNELTQSAMNNGKAMGTEFVVHGVCSNFIIEDNLIHNNIGSSDGGNYGLGVNSGYDTTESFTDFVVQRNKIINCGRRAISCNAWVRGIVKDNQIENDETAFPHDGITFDQERNTQGTPTSDGFSIIDNYISGSNIRNDINVTAGTNYTIVRPTDPPDETPPDEPPPIDPPIEPPVDPVCNTEVLTTVQIKVNGIITKTTEYLTIG